MIRPAVAPFAGAWIEMIISKLLSSSVRSLPSRERGLKYRSLDCIDAGFVVAPFAGAWIEIPDQVED